MSSNKALKMLDSAVERSNQNPEECPMQYDLILDVSNEESPIPIIRTSEFLNSLAVGEVLKVVVNKESAIKNIKTLISNNPYTLLDTKGDVNGFELYIKKCEERVS
jgi:tRNA 2-thiouridine synthesizing protein A